MKISDQIRELAKVFLDGISANAADDVSPDDSPRLRAYLVLSHAVFEEAIEEAFREHFSSLEHIVKTGKAHRALIALALTIDRQQLTKYKKRNAPMDVIRLGKSAFESRVRANHGVKRNNIETLSQSAGIEWIEFEDHLDEELAHLTTLGTKRDEVGHLSPFNLRMSGISEDLTRSSVEEWVNNGLQATEKMIAYIQKYNS